MRQLLAIRTHGSLAKAAKALGVSQPNLSASMARLEDRLKVKLFERSASGSMLTPIGELIAERASKVVRETEQIMRDTTLLAGGAAGALRLGFGAALPVEFMGELVRRLADAYPRLEITTIVLDREQLIPLLRAGELEVAICSYGDELVEESFLATEVFTATAVAVAHPDHELVASPDVSMERFVHFPSAGALQKQLNNAAVLGLAPAAGKITQYRGNHYGPLMHLVLHGHATMIAPEFVVRPYIEAGRLRRINLDCDFKLSFAAITTRIASYSPVVRRAVQYAADLGGETQPHRPASNDEGLRKTG